jgi:hypothetical protein
MLPGGFDLHPLIFEPGQIFRDRVVTIHLALVDENHERGAGDGLALRRDPENGVGAHRRLLREVHETDDLV